MRSIQVEGHPATTTGLHATLVAVATAYIDEVHHAQCTLQTPIMYARMDCHGVGEDLNQAVRMLAVALSQRRQLVLLPPAPQTARHQCQVPISIPLDAKQPWHWLAGQSLPLESIFVLSACHKMLLQEMPDVIEAMAQSASGNVTRTARALGFTALGVAGRESGTLWRSHIAISKHVPKVFQRQGLLWWFQVLTTYLVRIRGPLAQLIEAHPAMQPFLKPNRPPPGGNGGSGDPASGLRWLGWNPHTTCAAARFCDGVGTGWAPSVWFDAAVHIRQGDACHGASAGSGKYASLRKCDLSLSAAIERLRAAGVHNGSLFFASDSRHLIDQLEAGGARPFVGTYLRINRTRFETGAGTQHIELRTARLSSLVEALMDMVLLARSSVLAGKMMSNFPRLALQLRVRMPSAKPAYVSLDGRPWCTRTSCRDGFADREDQNRSLRRELLRNPVVAWE